jgi:undecaprenyl-diphosphatase
MRPQLEVAALGLIQGAAELLPVSSSAHVAAVPQILSWSLAEWEPARRKELEVALHAGACLALAPALWRSLPDWRLLALSLLPPVAVGYFLERPIEERLGGPVALSAGLWGGALALVLADRGSAPKRRRWRRGSMALGLGLGVAQAAALFPGVSRTGATLAFARAVGFSRSEASQLSFGVAGPVLVGATVLKAWRGRKSADLGLLATGVASAFAGTRLALRVFGLERREPLWPYAAERAVLGVLLLRYGRSR